MSMPKGFLVQIKNHTAERYGILRDESRRIPDAIFEKTICPAPACRQAGTFQKLLVLIFSLGQIP